MGRYVGPVCRLCRREGMKLFLKGKRCQSAKCSLAEQKRSNPPGMHNWRKGKMSQYGQRLREKQKVKRYYGVYERQFKNYFALATQQAGNTGDNLLILLERRLDNALCRGGLAYSRAQARQMINHGHVSINGKKVDVASYLVRVGDVIAPVNKKSSEEMMKVIYESCSTEVPSWIERALDKAEIKIVNMPVRNEITDVNIQEQLIIEFCSR